jgi:hypothetical protein
MNSIMAFSTQFYDPNSTEPQTPISSMQFLNTIKERSNIFGRTIGVEYAEGFTTERYIGVKDIFDLF